ncbi:SGNH/GDSL hydrolase family protein [Flexivirga meconopsidis]|uniref:SGNH/GDSL hydrolase family protein n=1 Tax=Flexivirga meconopsidis TaxID=2977121 RepID=UPI002240076C
MSERKGIRWCAAVVAAGGMTVALVVPATAATSGGANKWFGTWGVAVATHGVTGTSATGFGDQTLRQVARISVGGSAIRLRFSNLYGDRPLVIGATTVARRAAAGGAAVDPRSVRGVTFGGQRTVTIPAGEDVQSDPVVFRAEAGSEVVVSSYFPQATGPVTWHWLGLSTNYTATGDESANGGAAFAVQDSARYFLSGISVRTPARGTVAFFGDSITDGNGTPVDADLRYPDQVAKRLMARPGPKQCGVLNQSISGNRLLAGGLVPEAGDPGVDRFARDIARPGVKSVVVLEGINDILTIPGITADQITAGYQSLIKQGHAQGVTVVGGTLTPYEGYEGYTPQGEAIRQQVNSWIRSSGAFDSVVDFDAAVRDPAKPTQLLPAYASPDWIHPNATGYGIMANAVDLQKVC